MSALSRYLAFRRTLGPRPPLEHRTVHARGLDFAVYHTPRVHDAPPLLCINGGLLFDHTLLWPALAPLAATRQLIFYDQRGRGRSQVPPGHLASRIEFDASDVVALRDALHLEQVALLGHSWGGGIAMLAAALDAASIERLVLVNAVGVTSRWLPPLHDAALARLTGTQRDRLESCDVRTLAQPDLDAHAAYAQAFFPAWFADQSFAHHVTPPVGTSRTGAAIAARLRREGYDWTDRLRDLRAPTLVVHGAADVLPLSEAARTAAHLAAAGAAARVMPIADAGHNPFWEAPEAFFAAVQAFLTEGCAAP
jgi:proline iminopeptidase